MAALGFLNCPQDACAYPVAVDLDAVREAVSNADSRKLESLFDLVWPKKRENPGSRPKTESPAGLHLPTVASGSAHADSETVSPATDPPLIGILADEAILIPIRFLDGIFRPPRC